MMSVGSWNSTTETHLMSGLQRFRMMRKLAKDLDLYESWPYGSENENWKWKIQKKLDFIILSRLKKVLGNMKGRIYLYVQIDKDICRYTGIKLRECHHKVQVTWDKRLTRRECVNTGAAGAQTRRSLGHHLLHPLILRPRALFYRTDCTRRSKFLTHALLYLR